MVEVPLKMPQHDEAIFFKSLGDFANFAICMHACMSSIFDVDGISIKEVASRPPSQTDPVDDGKRLVPSRCTGQRCCLSLLGPSGFTGRLGFFTCEAVWQSFSTTMVMG